MGLTKMQSRRPVERVKFCLKKKKGFGERSEVLVDGEQEEQIIKRWKDLVGYIHRKLNSRLVVQLWIQRQ